MPPTRLVGLLPPLLEKSSVGLLSEKGAFEGDIQARAAGIMARLGEANVQRALSSPSLWRQLKAIASVASPPIQLILPSELQRQIDARIASGIRPTREAKKKQAKAASKDQGPGRVAAPLPSQVQVNGVFVNGTTGVLLNALSLAQQRGILSTPSEPHAIPFLEPTRFQWGPCPPGPW